MKRRKLRLPHVLNIALDAGGIQAAMGLAKALGGRTIYCSRALGDNHPLVIAAGRTAANALAEEYGGQMLTIPQGIPARRVALLEALERDMSLNQAAGAAGMNIRSASRAKAALKAGSALTWTDMRSAPKPRQRDGRQIDLEDFLPTKQKRRP